MTKSKDNDKGSRSKITKHEGTSLQCRQRQRSQELDDKSNLVELTKECHNELTSGEIASLKISKNGTKKITATTTTSVTDARLKALIEQGVADALAEREADISRNGDDSHDSGTGVRRQAPIVRECTYSDFLKCQPLNFKGTKGVVVPWKTLKKMMTDKYCPRGEIKKLEIDIWNLKVKGTDVVSYNQRFQELALMCDRMFPEESDEIEKYVGGLPNIIYESVMASKPKTMRYAIEFRTELTNRKINTLAERQPENKRNLITTTKLNNSLPRSKMWL
nr:reverse transcriptase domain-containing protein [Tanacetum cinerariifolium]